MSEQVWMSTLRRRLNYHVLHGEKATFCGRYIGKIGDPLPNPRYRAVERGWLMDLDEAVNRHEATLCPRCAEAVPVVAS